MSPFYRCDACDVRWSWIDGRHCWVCNALGQGTVGYTITSIDAFLSDLDEAAMPHNDHP